MKLLAHVLMAGALAGLFSDRVQAQSPDPIDSLKEVIRAAESDTTRLSAMIALSERIYAENPDTNKIICNSTRALADRALATTGVGSVERSTILKYKATAINNLAASYYIFGDLDSALICFREARAIHAANNYVPGIADALNNEGLILGIMGRYAEQRDMLFRAKAVYEHAGNTSATAKALNNIATYYKNQGKPDSALLCLDSCLRIYQGLQDRKGLADTRLNIGEALGEQGQAAQALEHYLACERIYKELKDRRGLSVCLGNIASVLDHQGLKEEALRYAHRSLDLRMALGDSLGQAAMHMNIGGMLEDQDEHDMALAEYAKSLALFSRAGARSNEAEVHGHIGDALKNKGDMGGALEHYRTSMAIGKAIDAPVDIANALYKLGHYYEQAGQLDSALADYRACLAIDRRVKDRESESYTLYSIARVKLLQHHPPEAEQWARRSLKLANELGFPRNIMRATGVLHRALEQQGKWREALQLLKLHDKMADSVEDKETAKQTLRLQLRYAFRKTRSADSLQYAVKAAQLDLQRRSAMDKAERTSLRNKAITAGAILLLLGGGVSFRLDRRRRKAKYQRDAACLELKALRAQMNPHFIFNALASINDYVTDNERDLASNYLTKFALLMRLVLENSRKAQVTLAKDLKALELYMELERLRMDGKFEYRINLDPALAPEEVMVPPLALQPFAENAIWHGIAHKAGTGRIDISIKQEADRLIATITDDGVGMSATTEATSTGDKHSLGTKITHDRLALIGEQHGVQAGFRYLKTDKGTCVEVVLPWTRLE